VGNAMAYGTPGGAVTVTSEVAGGTARLAVHNMGEPVPQEMLASLFEPMVRGEPGDSGVTGTRSVGLGLFIVRAIAVAHGGDVSVDSSRDGGTTFTFTFPCS
jgi:sigma-B regulation protein RsbU (phosphoserine phosphatase)